MTVSISIEVPHEVFLLRHGETVWNKEGRIQGQLDSELTALGRNQALRQGQTLKRIRKQLGTHQIVSSPLTRAQTTAKLALGAAQFITDPRIAEIGCGRWENTTHDQRLERDPEIASALSEDFDLYANAPDGEGLEKLTTRLVEFLNDLEGPTIVFSHKIALVVMRALLCGDASALSSSMAPPQGSILQIKNRVPRFHV